MEEHCHRNHHLGIIFRLLIRRGLDEFLIEHLDQLPQVICTSLGTMYAVAGSNGRRGPGPNLKADRANF
jgi:hypothetical protein